MVELLQFEPCPPARQAVGALTGDGVGKSEGEAEGLGVGAVGVLVGDRDGASEGVDEGIGVGGVGVLVGVDDGESVGADEGIGVGGVGGVNVGEGVLWTATQVPRVLT